MLHDVVFWFVLCKLTTNMYSTVQKSCAQTHFLYFISNEPDCVVIC